MFKFVLKKLGFVSSFLAVFLLISCSSYRPILDPHGRYLEVGKAQSDEDIDSCKDEAEREELGNYISRQSKSLEKKVELASSI